MAQKVADSASPAAAWLRAPPMGGTRTSVTPARLAAVPPAMSSQPARAVLYLEDTHPAGRHAGWPSSQSR